MDIGLALNVLQNSNNLARTRFEDFHNFKSKFVIDALNNFPSQYKDISDYVYREGRALSSAIQEVTKDYLFNYEECMESINRGDEVELEITLNEHLEDYLSNCRSIPTSPEYPEMLDHAIFLYNDLVTESNNLLSALQIMRNFFKRNGIYIYWQ